MKNTYLPFPMKVEKIITEDPEKNLKTFDLSFAHPDDEKNFKYMPGQFCEFSILGKGESPFGIASSPTEFGFLRFTVSRTGSVTNKIHHLREGDIVGMRGPMGNWYPVEHFKGRNIVIIGGGFAFTTLRSLLVYLLAHRDDYADITMIYGARNPDLFIYKDELEKWRKRSDMDLQLTIDTEVKGWDQNVGFVPSVTEQIAPEVKNTEVVVCGPPVMIKFTLPVLVKLGFKGANIYTSLERRMKCGIGKCGRCNIGSQYVCIDGPVFSLDELKMIHEAF